VNLFDSKRLTFAQESNHFDENRKTHNMDSPKRKIKFRKKEIKKHEMLKRKPSCDNLIRKNIAKNLKSNVFKTGILLIQIKTYLAAKAKITRAKQVNLPSN
jgi:hypothetical protein